MRKKKWVLCALGIMAVVIVLFFVVCNVLVDVALVPAKMEQTEAFSEITEQSLEALVHTDDIAENKVIAESETENWLTWVRTVRLSVMTEDGYRLEGQAFLQEEVNHKWVLLLHGYTGWKEAMFPIAYQYYQMGYQILCPDMRCNGESEGDFIGMGWTDRVDNLLWLNHITGQDADAQIVIHGQSMGAACALMMTGEVLPGQVKAVVSDGAYTDVYTIFQKQIKEWFNLPAFPVIDGANLVLQMRGGYNIKQASAFDAVKKSKVPILFIHGIEDVFIPVEMGEELYQAADCEKELLLVDGAGHAQAQDKDPDAYYGTVFSFLLKYISSSGASC